MATSESSPEIFSIILCLILVCISYCLNTMSRWAAKKSSAPTNWPIVGMMPAAFGDSHCLHDRATEVLKETGGTFTFKGPWFANLDFLLTSDPSNIHHILIKNVPNYQKGPEFQKIFDFLQYGIINADSERAQLHRKFIISLLSQSNFYKLLERTVWLKVEKGLLPVLDSFAEQGAQVGLQEIFQRFSFDSICKLMLDHDPGSLSLDLPIVPCERAFDDAMEALLYRHIWPETCWKLQKWLGIGKEKKLSKAIQVFDQFIYSCITSKQDKLSKSKVIEDADLLTWDSECLTAIVEAYREKTHAFTDDKRFLRDIMLNLVLAGRDTSSSALTWLFWLLATNPSVEIKILEEIGTKLNLKEDQSWRFFSIEESRELIYLHGALCETLRLFPPVPFERKDAVESDILPSGLHIGAKTKVVFSFYAMGRMEWIWGKDCLQFKPERWISERGRIRHEPSYRFPAFLGGPRACLGKEISFIQMKMVAATIIYNYQVQPVDGHLVSPKDSLVLKTKHGLFVRLSRRS